MRNSIVVVGVMSIMMSACVTTTPVRHRRVVEMVDISGSIPLGAQVSALESAKNILPELNRGDALVIIPVLGDVGDIQGRIIRVDRPLARKTYDQDVRDAEKALDGQLQRLMAWAKVHPGAKTDLLGTLAVAAQELAVGTSADEYDLIILSDLIQEDGRTDFARCSELRSQATSLEFAQRLTRQTSYRLPAVRVYLGLLRSSARIDLSRREAIESFWFSYLAALGAKPKIASDGPGQLPYFLTPPSTQAATRWSW